MATAVPTPFHGTSVAWETSFIAKVISATHSGISRTIVETTARHTATTPTYRTFEGGYYINPGVLNVEMQFDATTLPPITETAETVTISFPGTTPSTWAASAVMSNFSWTGTDDSDDVMTATAELQLTGALTNS